MELFTYMFAAFLPSLVFGLIFTFMFFALKTDEQRDKYFVLTLVLSVAIIDLLFAGLMMAVS